MPLSDHCDREFREIVEAMRQFVRVFPGVEASFRIDEHTTVTKRAADLLKEVEEQTEIGQRMAAILKKLAEDAHMSPREFTREFLNPDYTGIVGCCGADCKAAHGSNIKQERDRQDLFLIPILEGVHFIFAA